MRLRVFALLLCFLPLFSHAQIGTGDFLNTSLAIELSPAFPSPGDSFTATINDYSSDAYGATIEWSYNDSALDWAFNKRSIELTAPAAGESAALKAVLKKPTGSAVTLTQTITPLYVDIIIEPQTHVPSFFQGRALPSPGSTVNATALLGTDTLLTGDYLYTWRINATVIQGGPLRGGNRISFIMPQDSTSVLSLTVTRLDGRIIARRSISIPVAAPKLLFYEVSTLYGMLTKALQSPFPFIAGSATLRAEPYYLDSAVFNNPSVANWYIDGAVVPSGQDPYDITLEKTGDAQRTNIQFRVQSTTKLLQGTKGSLILDVL